MKRFLTIVIGLAVPCVATGQASPAPIAGSLVKKAIPRTSVIAGTSTSLATVPAYEGITCDGGCIVARSAGGKNASVRIRLQDGSVNMEELRTTVILPHDKSHSLRLTLDESEVLGLLCNGHDLMTALPKFRVLGATKPAFKWAIYDGQKMVSSGHSNGDAIKVPGKAGSMGPMQVAVFNDGTIEVSHGKSRLVMSTDDIDGVRKLSGSGLRFEDLGLWVANVDQFALTSAAIQGVARK